MSSKSVTKNSATIFGTVDPNSLETTYHFEYGKTTALGTSTEAKSAGTGTSPVSVEEALTGLSVLTLYYYRLVATNAVGTVESARGQFRTLPLEAPVVTEIDPTFVTDRSARLNGTVNPNGHATTYWFVFGKTKGLIRGGVFVHDGNMYDGTWTVLNGTMTPNPAISIGSGTSDVVVGADMLGLEADAAYFTQLIANNSEGTTYSDFWIVNTTIAAATLTGSLAFPAFLEGDATGTQDLNVAVENSGGNGSTLEWNSDITLDAGIAGKVTMDIMSGNTVKGTPTPVVATLAKTGIVAGTYAGLWTVTPQSGITPATMPISLTVAPEYTGDVPFAIEGQLNGFFEAGHLTLNYQSSRYWYLNGGLYGRAEVLLKYITTDPGGSGYTVAGWYVGYKRSGANPWMYALASSVSFESSGLPVVEALLGPYRDPSLSNDDGFYGSIFTGTSSWARPNNKIPTVPQINLNVSGTWFGTPYSDNLVIPAGTNSAYPYINYNDKLSLRLFYVAANMKPTGTGSPYAANLFTNWAGPGWYCIVRPINNDYTDYSPYGLWRRFDVTGIAAALQSNTIPSSSEYFQNIVGDAFGTFTW